METTEKKSITYTYNKDEIIDIINKTVKFIENWIKENNYRIINNKNSNSNNNLDIYMDIHINWNLMSYNKMKKIQKYSFWILKHPTRKRVNAFFSLLSKSFQLSDCLYVKQSLKEELIQKRRRDWLKSKNEADELLKIYKEEKGDFYKNKIIFSQK